MTEKGIEAGKEKLFCMKEIKKYRSSCRILEYKNFLFVLG